MSAMKPDGKMVDTTDGLGILVYEGVKAGDSVYTLATVRKWLEEEPSEEMLLDAQFHDGVLTAKRVWQDMIYAKLLEMGDGK